MSFFDFFSNLNFRVVHSPFPNQYPDIHQVPDDVPYSELNEISIVLVQDLPPHIKALIEIEEEIIEQKIILPGELESITEYTIESVSNNPDSYLITKYTSYQ